MALMPGLAIGFFEKIRFLGAMRTAAARAAAVEDLWAFDVEIVLADNCLLQDLNRRFRGVDAPTDVLSFPANDIKGPISAALAGGFVPERSEDGRRIFLGDIYISLEKARENAYAYGNTDREELCFLTVHGMLHLMGYDHIRTEDEHIMRARQREILGRDAQAGKGD